MRTILLICCIVLLAGCTLPNGALSAQRTPDEEKAQAMQESAMAGRAKDFMKQGMSYRDARALAESEYYGFSSLGKMDPARRVGAGLLPK